MQKLIKYSKLSEKRTLSINFTTEMYEGSYTVQTSSNHHFLVVSRVIGSTLKYWSTLIRIRTDRQNQQIEILLVFHVRSPLYLNLLSTMQFSFRFIHSLRLPVGAWLTWTDTLPFHASTIIYLCDGTPDDTIKHSIHSKNTRSTLISNNQAYTSLHVVK